MVKYIDEEQFIKHKATLSAGALQIYAYFTEYLPDANGKAEDGLPKHTYVISTNVGSIKDVHEDEIESFYEKTINNLNELKEKGIISSYSEKYYNRDLGNVAEFTLSPHQ